MSSSRRISAAFWLLVGMVSLAGCTQFQQVKPKFSPSAARQQRETRLHMARAHAKEGDLSKAEAVYRLMLTENQNDAEAKYRLGVILVRRGKMEEGLAKLEEAVQQNPQDISIRNDLGYAYLLQGEVEKAEQEFRAALDISPRHAQSLNNLGLALGYQGRTREAYAVFRQTMPEAEALANLGYAHAQRGEVDQAIQQYSRALSHDPTLRSAAEGIIQVSTVRERAIAAHRERTGETQLASQPESKEAGGEIIQAASWSHPVATR